MEETCKNCRKKGFGLKRCTGCLRVSYCSKHCQAADWKDGHKRKCKKLKDSEGNLPDTRCASCGLDQNLMKCLGCYTVHYCLPICQQQHWEVHKEDCIRSKSEIDDVIVTNGYKKHLEEEQENQREKSKFSWPHPLPFGLSGDKSRRSKTDSVDLSLRGSTSEKDRRQAKLFAERKFPLNHVTDDLERIQHGLIGCGSTQAFVAFILRYHEKRERHGVYVQIGPKEVLTLREEDFQTLGMKNIGDRARLRNRCHAALQSEEQGDYQLYGKIIAYCLVHIGPSPAFFSEFMYGLIAYGPEKTELILDDITDKEYKEQVQKIESSTDIASFFDAVDPRRPLLDYIGALPLALPSKKNQLVQALCRHVAVTSVEKSLEQLRNGLNCLGVLDKIKSYPDVLRDLFVYKEKELDAIEFDNMFNVVFSQEGSNKYIEELRVQTYWRDYLQEIEDTQTNLRSY